MNRKIITDVLYLLLFLVVFMLMQTLCVVVVSLCHVSVSTALILSSALSSVFTIALFVGFRWSYMGMVYILSRPVKLLLLTALLALALILPMQYLEESLSIVLPERFAIMFESIISHPWGYLIIGILAPITEEVVFRGAILRRLLLMGCHVWVAIVASAILFGAVHGNLAQFTHAFLMGLLLGWLYIKTRSIIPCLVIHWVNNTIAFLLLRLFPEHAEDNMLDLFSGNTFILFISIVISFVVALWALWRMVVCVKKK